MARANAPFVVFTGGEIGKESLARTTLDTYVSSAEILQNCMAEPSGKLHFRPGLRFMADLTSGTGKTRGIEFVYDNVSYGILLSASEVRFETGGDVLVRVATTAVIVNSDFSDGVTGADWTDVSDAGGTVSVSSAGLVLTSNGTDSAAVRQAVPVTVGTEVGVRIIVARGPVTLSLGSTAGGSEYTRTVLRAGTHSIGVTPTATTLYVQVSATSIAEAIVTSCSVEAAGDIVLPTPWTEADVFALMHETSNNVVWMMSGGRQMRLERRGATSWSIVDTDERDGPWNLPNTDESYQITPSVKTGNGTLTSNRALFSAGHVGGLWRLTHSGQSVSRTCSGDGQFTDFIKVQGAGSGRSFAYEITGTFSATITLQRSIGNTTSWTDLLTFTGTVSPTGYNDGSSFDNQTVYFRIGVKTGDYTSGSAVVSLTYTGGSTEGVVRVTAFTSTTSVDVEVLDPLGDTAATAEWAEGLWSATGGYPNAVALFDGRLWQGGPFDKFVGSVSDAYDSYEPGDDDADAISRAVAIGSAKRIKAFLPLARLAVLTNEDAVSVQPLKIEDGPPIIKSTAFDEPLTPSNLTVRNAASARGVFIDASSIQAMELYYSVEAQDYQSRSMMRLHKDLGRPGLVQIAMAKKPDRRMFFVRADGQLLVKMYDPTENVLGWSRFVTDGAFESVYVKRAANEDQVMCVVKRTVGGQTKRYLEKLDPIYLDSATAANRCDSFVRVENAAGFTTVTGLSHLEGRTVKVWTDGASHPDRVVSGGSITLERTAYACCAGLYYEGLYESIKLAMVSQGGTALAQIGRPVKIAFILDRSTRAIEYGGDFDTMDWLSDRSIETPLDEASGLWSGTTEPIAIPGDSNRDPRVCLRFQSPAPVSILGYVISHQTQERAA